MSKMRAEQLEEARDGLSRFFVKSKSPVRAQELSPEEKERLFVRTRLCDGDISAKAACRLLRRISRKYAGQTNG